VEQLGSAVAEPRAFCGQNEMAWTLHLELTLLSKVFSEQVEVPEPELVVPVVPVVPNCWLPLEARIRSMGSAKACFERDCCFHHWRPVRFDDRQWRGQF
jgi:hypothetical protein